MKKLPLLRILIVALLISVAANVYQLLASQPQRSWHPAEHRAYIRQASELWSTKSGESLRMISQYRYAKVIVMGQEVCVNLALEPGSLGGEPTYCFDQTSGVLARRFDEVE